MKRRALSVLLALVVLGAALPAVAIEQLDLTAPLTPPSTTSWRVDEIRMAWTAKLVVVVFLGSNGERQECRTEDTAAVTLMTALNTANLTSNSLHKRAINHYVSTGCLGTGSITGSP